MLMGMSASQGRFLFLTARKNDLEYKAQQISQQRMILADESSNITKEYSDALSNTKLVYRVVGEDTKLDLSYHGIINPVAEGGLGMRITNSAGNIVVATKDEVPETKTLKDLIKDGTYSINRIIGEIDTESLGADFDLSAYASEIVEPDEDFWSKFTEGDPSVAYLMDYNALGEYYYLTDKDGNIILEEPETEVVDSSNYWIDETVLDPTTLEKNLRDGVWYLSSQEPNGDYEQFSIAGTTQVQEVFDTSDDSAAVAKYEYETKKIAKIDKKLELELKQIESEHKAIETEIDNIKNVIKGNVESSYKTFSG